MAERGIFVEKTPYGYEVEAGNYKIVDTEIPSDFTALSYMLAAVVAVPNARLTVPNYRPSTMSSERECFEAFAKLGAKTEFDEQSRELRIWRDDPVSRVIEINGVNIPTVTAALCTAACFADADVTLHGASHVNLHKCQRLMVMVEQLKAMGCAIEPHFTEQGSMDGFIARGKSTPAGGVSLRSFGDHRVLGALFAAGLGAVSSVEIDGAENMAAGYPAFFQEIRDLGASFESERHANILPKAS